MKSEFQTSEKEKIESCLWIHNIGANTRQNLFNLNEDICQLPRKRSDSDHILDPTLTKSQQRQLLNQKNISLNKSIEEVKLFEQSYNQVKSVNLQKSMLLDSKTNQLNSISNSFVSYPVSNNMNLYADRYASADSFKKIEIINSQDNSHRFAEQRNLKILSNSSCDMRTDQYNFDNDASRKLDESKNVRTSNPQRYEDSPVGEKIKLNLIEELEQQYCPPEKFRQNQRQQSPVKLRDWNSQRESVFTVQTEFENRNNAPQNGVRLNNKSNNLFGKMKVSQLTKKFIGKIKSGSQKYNFRQLTKKHFDTIGDTASFYINDSKNKSLSDQKSINDKLIYLISAFSTAINNIQPTNPESTFAVLCDIIYAVILLAYLFVIPIQLSFNVKFVLFSNIVFVVFIINLVFSLNKSYYYKGRMISNRKMILINFIKTQFIIDLLVFMSIRLSSFQFICFFKFSEVHLIIKRADNHFQMISKYPIAFTLTNLVVKMTLIAQIAGCAFHYVAYIEIQRGQANNWLASKGVEQDSWEDRYIISIYFSFITMMTVGYGDVTPVNNQERIYVIFMTLLSSGMFGYVVNTIGELYMTQRQKLESFQKRKQEITVYMDERNIDNHSKLKVLNYLEYAFQYQKKKEQDALTLFQDIPQNLVDDIYFKYFGKYLFENKIMKLNFSEKFLKALSLSMKEKNIAPNQYLFQKGDRGSEVYFLVGGSIDIVIENAVDSISFLTIENRGHEIGLKNAFIDKERMMSVKCSKEQMCTLVYFEMHDFKTILGKFNKDFERFCELRDEIIFNNNNLDTKCSSCSRYDHDFNDCPLISLSLPYYNIISKQQSPGEPNVRQQHKRREYSNNAVVSIQNTREKLRKYRMSLVQLIVPDLKDQGIDFNEISDKFFYSKMPTVKIFDGEQEAELEEHNIFEDYETIIDEDHMRGVVDEEDDSYTNYDQMKKDEEHIQISTLQEVENLQSSSYSSGANQQILMQLQPFNGTILASNSALSNQNNSNNSINVNHNQNVGVHRESFQSQLGQTQTQKMSFFSKKQTIDGVDIALTQPNPNQNHQSSSRNLSFRRERGDSFYPPIKQKQYVQQRSSKIFSNRKISELHIPSSQRQSIHNLPAHHNHGIHELHFTQQLHHIYILDFDKMKTFEKYFPHFNYSNVLRKMLIRKKSAIFGRTRRNLKTQNGSPSARRKSRKINLM